MNKELGELIGSVCEQLFGEKVDVELNRPEEQFGDFSCNIALQLAGKLKKNPKEIAEQVAQKLNEKGFQANVAGPGFINIKLSDKTIFAAAQKATDINKSLAGKTVIAEYSDPNPFKVLHAGHLYTSVMGDAIAKLHETAGAKVHRVNYGGDVGLHVAKAMWGIIKNLGGENPEKLDDIAYDQRADWMAAAYVSGNDAYENEEQAKTAIVDINKKVYELHKQGDESSAFARIYWTCRAWSYEYFDVFYARIGTSFEKYYPESETVDLGIEAVNEQLEKGVYAKSDGAIIFAGEKYGLHTRVFINSNGLPTYEAKDVGLSLAKWRDYKPDKSLIITGNDIVEYMKVVLKSIEQFKPKLSKITYHITHGNVKLVGGVKMSSRKGNVLRAVDILDAATEASQNKDDDIVLGAVKYSFLKSRIGGDIIYDAVESVSHDGNSGPYIQYALVRARSILHKIYFQGLALEIEGLDRFERSLARKISMYPVAFELALDEYSPHHICTYLYELAQTFNRFYENSRVVGDPREVLRIRLVAAYKDVLENGLDILGMPKPEKM